MLWNWPEDVPPTNRHFSSKRNVLNVGNVDIKVIDKHLRSIWILLAVGDLPTEECRRGHWIHSQIQCVNAGMAAHTSVARAVFLEDTALPNRVAVRAQTVRQACVGLSPHLMTHRITIIIYNVTINIKDDNYLSSVSWPLSTTRNPLKVANLGLAVWLEPRSFLGDGNHLIRYEMVCLDHTWRYCGSATLKDQSHHIFESILSPIFHASLDCVAFRSQEWIRSQITYYRVQTFKILY